ncbi:hypothetical protein VTI74DRAFT_6826 [Chaetomium olivicolor]
MDSRIEELEKQLRAAQQRAAWAEEERARAEEERARAEEERARAEEERARAEEERARAEEERARAEEERARAEEERARAEEERARAEEERARAEEERARVEEESRPTTLSEYVEACHHLVYTKFTVETNMKLTSKGSITSPVGRRCPHRLEPWADFLEEQRTILGTLLDTFPESIAAFRSRHYMSTRGEVVAATRVADEDALKLVLQDLVAEPVSLIVGRLQDEDTIKAKFDIWGGIAFQTRINALGDAGQGVEERPRTPDGRTLRPDQICAYTQDNGDPTGLTMAYIIEHKAPHKLTLPHLRLGLRPMNLVEDVVNRPTVPPREEEEAHFQYHADKLSAAAVTQTFDYMIQGGLTYGCLTTGEAFVFLKVDWTHPITLFYHLAEPGPEVDEHGDNFLCCTAVSQVLAFTILALDSHARPVPGQDDRWRVVEKLKTWTVDWDSVLQSIPETARTAPPTSPAYKPRTYKGIDRSPILLRQAKSRAAGRMRCKPGSAEMDPSPESDGDRGEPRVPGTPTPAQSRKAQRDPTRHSHGNSGGAGPSTRGGRVSNRQYCTQKCLLGLVAGDVLDEECPNVTLHRGIDGDRRHPVDHAAWLCLLREQLRRTLDEGIVPLGKQGARGALFQVTLLTYGYTFVAKATTARFVRELEHEAKVYQRLRPLQGDRVPVFLGAVDLRQVGRTYYYDIDVRIIYLMFVSWGGRSLVEAEVSDKAKVAQWVVQSVEALHMQGVVHTDVRAANVLWDEGSGQVMVIDFEQALLVERPSPALASLVPNVKAQHTTTGKPRSKDDAKAWLGMQHDIMEASMVFHPR